TPASGGGRSGEAACQAARAVEELALEGVGRGELRRVAQIVEVVDEAHEVAGEGRLEPVRGEDPRPLLRWRPGRQRVAVAEEAAPRVLGGARRLARLMAVAERRGHVGDEAAASPGVAAPQACDQPAEREQQQGRAGAADGPERRL